MALIVRRLFPIARIEFVMAKRKRSYDNWDKPLLSCIPDGKANVIEYALRPRSKRVETPGPICCCPPSRSNQLGGCRPGLAWSDSSHTAIKPICRTCLKPLVAGYHRRCDQTHPIGLAIKLKKNQEARQGEAIRLIQFSL